MFTTHIENVNEEIKIEVDFDYQPHEASTWTYEGCSESVDINEVRIAETKVEICLLKDAESDVEDALLDWIHDEQEFAEYGYMEITNARLVL